jgi:RNA polymerase sigma-54 factor
MQTIADYQFDFFSKGPEFLIPMVYRHIVEKTGADKSTISRVVNGKYVQTSHGIYELRSLFTEGSETDSGEEVSTNVIRNEITKMIEKEDKKKPLSDDILKNSIYALFNFETYFLNVSFQIFI